MRTFEREESEARWTIDQVCYFHFEKKIPLGEISILIRNMKNFRFTKLLINEIKKRKLPIRYINKEYSETLKSPCISYLLQILRYFEKREGKLDQEDANVQSEIRDITEPIDRVGAKDQYRKKVIESGEIRPVYVDESFYTASHMNYKAERVRNWNLFYDDWEKIIALVGEIKTTGYLECCRRIFGVLKKVKWGDLDLEETKIEEFYELLQDILHSLDSEVYSKSPLSIITNELLALTNGSDKDE